MVKRLARRDCLAWISLASVAAVLGLAFRDLAVDDAFVTYRYAFNLAHQQGYVYNSGTAMLSTTAPFYGLLLAFFAALGFDIPTISNFVSAVSIGASGMLLYGVGRRHGRRRLGWMAGILYVLNPLLWLSLGMETDFLLALVLAAFAADDYGMPGVAGLALGAAFVTRYDAALPAAILFFQHLWSSPRSAVKMAGMGVLAAAPVVIFLTLTFGSPLPITLLAKRAQNLLGVTGFYAGTGFVQGLLILLHGWFEQTWLYAFSGAALVGGLSVAIRREQWVLPYALWACAHVVAYIFLGSAPYYWYYAPLVPAVVWLIALAAEWGLGIKERRLEIGERRLKNRVPSRISDLQSLISNRNLQSAFSNLLFLLALAPFVFSLAVMWHAKEGSLPDSTSDASKVLPEPKVDVYRRVGEWVAANAPPTATLGATEIGVIGYYARRDVVDFLGLLQPDVAGALARGDPSWALFAYQPDYIALNAIHPLYTFDPRGDNWFRAAFRPVQRFDDERFWASPMVVYRRQAPRIGAASTAAPASATPVDALFGDGIRLVGVELSSSSLQAGEPLAARLWWRGLPVEKVYAVSVQLLGQDDLVVAQRESQLIASAGTTASQVALLGLPETACAPDSAQLNVVLYEPNSGARLPVTDANGNNLGDSFRFGRVAIERRGDAGNPVDISFGRALTLVRYEVSPRSVAPGETVRLTQIWRAGETWRDGLSLFVHMVSDDGRTVAQADGPAILTREDVRELRVPADAAEGVFRLLVGVYQREGGKRLPWLDAVGQPLGDSLALCPVRVR